MNRKESLLTKTSTAYLNSVHPSFLSGLSGLSGLCEATSIGCKVASQSIGCKVASQSIGKKLRVNLNEAPSKKLPGITVAPSKTSDVIYEYLKTFSKYSNRKNGVLINYNQYIAYNFYNKNLLLSQVDPLIDKYLKIKTNKNKSKNAVPCTFAFQLKKAKVAKTTLWSVTPRAQAKNINKNINININYPLKKPLLGLYPYSKKNTPRAPFAIKHRTEEPNAQTGVHRGIRQD